MLKKLRHYKGYLFLEGLLALFTVTMALTLLFPQFVFLKQQVQKAEDQVIRARILQEETQAFVENRPVFGEKVRRDKSYKVESSSYGITIWWGGEDFGFQKN